MIEIQFFMKLRSKDINIKFHWIRILVQEKEIILQFCSSKNQIVDIFIKQVNVEALLELKKMMEMIKLAYYGLREAIEMS